MKKRIALFCLTGLIPILSAGISDYYNSILGKIENSERFSKYLPMRMRSDPRKILRKLPNPLPNVRGELKLFPLSATHFAVAGNYDGFLTGRILDEFGDRLKMVEALAAKKRVPEWSRVYYYNLAAAEVMADYLKNIAENFQDPRYFTIQVNGKKVIPDAHGYWINAVGLKRMPRVGTEGFQILNSAELVPFAYFKLPAPLRNGDKLSVTVEAGDSVSEIFDDAKTISRAIKVNQVGYLPDAGMKYAYLGMWLGELGALPVIPLLDKPFHLCDSRNGKTVFSGKLAIRSGEQFTEGKNKTKIPLNGELTLEMDFSEYRKPGLYHIRIPGVGRSWDFQISNDAIGRAFYVQMRGLYHQRSGIAKTESCTKWTIGADHTETYRGGFAPNNWHYSGKTSCFKNSEGKTVSAQPFEMVRKTATNKVVPNLRGGWWDAGDFDRRTYHFTIVDDLLSVYFLHPGKFKDSQLDIPESGNGVPDIVDEAAWGVEVWRRAQSPDGGIGCWIEADSHPKEKDPVKDSQRYYLALPTRESSMLYAAYAAKLARAYRMCGKTEESKKFRKSAEAAWTFAQNPANAAQTSFLSGKNGRIFYREPKEIPPHVLFKAALNLYMLTGEGSYAEVVRSVNFKEVRIEAVSRHSAYFLSELIEDQTLFPALSKQVRTTVLQRAEMLLKSQNQLTYRNVNWPLNHWYFLYLGWGEAMPFKKGNYLILAYKLTGRKIFRDSALLLADWMYGANPMGRSMTTGLGKVQPLRLLSLPSQAYSDFRAEPIPGITPYTFNGYNEYNAAKMIYQYEFPKREHHNFPGCSVNLLPASLRTGGKMSRRDVWNVLEKTVPLWRRFANLEDEAVPQNEFTVWETMSPAAAACAALLPDNWTPDPAWKSQPVEKDIRKLPGYLFLP